MKTVSLADGSAACFSPLQAEDAAASLRYLEAVAGETDFLSFGPGDFASSVEQQAEFLRSLEGGASGLMTKAVTAGEIAGVASIRRTDRPRIRHVGELGISVLKRYWGTGLGKAFLLYVLEQALEIGVTKVELRVRQDNLRAIRLYESVGFVIEGRPRAAFCVAGVYYDEYTMGLVQLP